MCHCPAHVRAWGETEKARRTLSLAHFQWNSSDSNSRSLSLPTPLSMPVRRLSRHCEYPVYTPQAVLKCTVEITTTRVDESKALAPFVGFAAINLPRGLSSTVLIACSHLRQISSPECLDLMDTVLRSATGCVGYVLICALFKSLEVLRPRQITDRIFRAAL